MLRLKTMMVCGLALASLAGTATAAEPPADAKPTRVLLFASAATREYQFVRNMLAREAGKGRVRLAVYLQTPPGRTEPREGVEQGATLLKKFPEVMMHKRTEDLGDQPDEMASYDAIVAFDPDWGQLSDDQQKLLKQWVEEGGGLVVVAGPVNTFQLARKANADKLKAVIDLYPVVPGDPRVKELNDATDKAFALHFPRGDKSPEFLQLDDGKTPLAGWDAFFFGDKEEHKENNLERGFYGVYPAESVKPGATVAATFADPKAKLADDTEAPFLVTSSAGKGRVVYLGSGELWRLRQYREAFHDRIWTGLIHYAAAPPKPAAPPEAKPSPHELSLEVKALRGLYYFALTARQMKDLAKGVKETAAPDGEHETAAKVSDEYLRVLTELHDALAAADDADRIDDLEDRFGELDDKEQPDLGDDVPLTAAARKQAPGLLRRLQPSQLASYVQQTADDAMDPRERLVTSLSQVRDLKRDKWKEQRDAIAEEVAEALAGLDAERSSRVSDQVVALLSKAHGLTAEEFKAQKADLETAAEEIAGSAGPDEVLRNRAEHALAELLSNPRLETALKARSK